MTDKERIPITPFEKWKSVMEALYARFFSDEVPDFEQFNNLLKQKNNRVNYLKKDELTALRNFYEISHKSLRKAIDRLSDAHDYLGKKMKDDGEIGKDIKDVEDALDQLYLSDTETVIEDGKLVIVKDQEKPSVNYKIERALWTFHRFNKRGKKTFRMEEQLTNELLLTDVNKVDSSFLQFPYPAICFYLPYNHSLAIRGEVIEFVYITERVQVGGDSRMVLEIIYFSKTSNFERHLFHIDEGELIPQIDSQVALHFQSPLARKEATSIVSFILAALLYMNSTNVSYKDVQPLFFHKKQDSKFPVCSLGYDIKIDKQLHQQTHNGDGLHRDIQVLKWTVRGHFRTYKKGDHWKEDKTIWIRPFIKGRERDNAEQKIKPTNYEVV